VRRTLRSPRNHGHILADSCGTIFALKAINIVRGRNRCNSGIALAGACLSMDDRRESMQNRIVLSAALAALALTGTALAAPTAPKAKTSSTGTAATSSSDKSAKTSTSKKKTHKKRHSKKPASQKAS
jgi:hypothetical protein